MTEEMHPAAWLSITQDGANRLWNFQPRLLHPGELIYQLYTADQRLSDWESNFICSIGRQLADGRSLTLNQSTTLDDIWERATAKG